MKKVNFKNAMMALVVTLSFVVFGAVQVDAQSLSAGSTSPYSLPVGDFTTPTEAQDILAAEMMELKGLMDGQSGAILTANERVYLYYFGIHASLESGQTVPKAIVDGYHSLNDSNGNGDLSNNVLLSLKQMAVSILEQ